jgi:putative transposase
VSRPTFYRWYDRYLQRGEPFHRSADYRDDQSAGGWFAAFELCRKHGLSPATFYKLKAKYGGMDLSDAKRLKQLEDENAKLKRLVADVMLDNVVLKDLLGKP